MKRSLAFIPPVVSRPIFSFKGLEGVARRRLINLAEILIAVWQYEIRLERSLMREGEMGKDGSNFWLKFPGAAVVTR